MKHNWDDHYASGDIPWEQTDPDPELVKFIEAGHVPRGRALDIGCGLGTNARYLASLGYDVLGIDIAQGAIERAVASVAAGEKSEFRQHDFLNDDPPQGPFDFIFDRGCLHVFDDPDHQSRFAERVAACLAPEGIWFSLLGSTEGGPREMGPPRRTAREIVNAVEPALEIVELRNIDMDTGLPDRVEGWALIARRRKVPAQASTILE